MIKRLFILLHLLMVATPSSPFFVIWAPWRMEYAMQATHDCVFCYEALSQLDRKHYVLKRSARCMIQLNPLPYAPGHMLVVPFYHVDSVSKLMSYAWLDMWDMVQEACMVLEKMGCTSYNIGMNVGPHAAGSKPSHIHIHIVPRSSPKNQGFMEIIGNTQILTEMLDETYERFLPFFKKRG